MHRDGVVKRISEVRPIAGRGGGENGETMKPYYSLRIPATDYAKARVSSERNNKDRLTWTGAAR